MNQVTKNIAHFDRKPFQYRSLTQVMKMHNNNIEGKIYYSVIDWTSSIAIAATCFPSFPFWSPFVYSLENHDLGLQYTVSQLSLLTASSTSSSIIAAATPIFFKCSSWSFHDGYQRSYTIVNGNHSILPSFQRTLYSRKKLENKTFPKASR